MYFSVFSDVYITLISHGVPPIGASNNGGVGKTSYSIKTRQYRDNAGLELPGVRRVEPPVRVYRCSFFG